MILDLDLIQQAANRYEDRVGQPQSAPKRTARKSYLERSLTTDRAKVYVYQADATVRGSQADTLRTIAHERMIGRSDLLDMNYLELAIAVARGVARIRLPGSYATGFLVGPGLLLTNNHVFENEESTLRAEVQFDYQQDSKGQLLPIHAYRIRADRVFVTDRDLDFTLVALADESSAGRPISAYPWTKLIATLGKAEKGDPINIIQHPLGQVKQIAFRDNQLLEIPSGGKADFLYYSTDTEPGSSGSPCFNDQWELIALHHSGVPKTENGQVLKTDGQPFREGFDKPETIDWIANEGARTSAIITALKNAKLEGEADALRDAALEAAAPNPVELARLAHESTPSAPQRSVSSAPARKSVSVVVKIEGDTIQSVTFENGTSELVLPAGAGAVSVQAPSAAPHQAPKPPPLEPREAPELDPTTSAPPSIPKL